MGKLATAAHHPSLTFYAQHAVYKLDIPGWSQRNERNEEEHTDKHTSLAPTTYARCAHHVLVSVLPQSSSTAEQEFIASCIRSIAPCST